MVLSLDWNGRHRCAPRRAWPALALLVLALAVPSAASAVETPARTSDSFVDSIGVNTHTFFSDTVYHSRFSTVKQRLAELGVRHVREELMPDRSDQYERLRELAGIGIRSTLIMGDPDDGAGALRELVSIAKDELGGALAAVEGSNEYDARGGTGWAAALRDHQSRLYAAVKSDPALARLPVVGPSIVSHRKKDELGDISSVLDYGNVHSYPDGYLPEDNLSTHLGRAAANSAAKPVMATETGYHTALAWRGEHKPTSPEAAATYMPRLFLEYFRRGVARTFSYELLDKWDEPQERESNFGLLHNDLSPKPAFLALRNTIAILSDPGPAFAPGALDFAFGGDQRELRHLLLQKRDGTFYLALWRADSVWDPVSRTPPAAAPTTPLTVEFGRRLHRAEVYMPNVSAAPIDVRPGTAAPVSLQVGPQVTILKVVPGQRKPARVKLWVSRRAVPAGGRVAVKSKVPGYAVGARRGVAIQHWRGRRWRTVGRGRTSRRGVFKKRLRLSPARFGRQPRLRVVTRQAKPSRAIRVRIRDRRALTAG